MAMALDVTLSTRLPTDLHRELRQEAAEARRSLNSEIVFRLQRSLRWKKARVAACEKAHDREVA
jgi:hypothetical protein